MQRNKKPQKFVGKGLLNKAINALPFELHFPGYQFCGPGTHLQERLNRQDKGINPLDAACRDHDIAYSHHKEDLIERHKADAVLAKQAASRIVAKNAKLGEKAAATITWLAMKVKKKIGAGIPKGGFFGGKLKKRLRKKKKTNKKKRYIPTPNKYGGFLPLLPLLGVLGSLVGGAAGVAKAVNDSRANSKRLAEQQRHNRAMEGRGLFLNPYNAAIKRSGKGLKKRNKKKSRR